MDLLTLASLPAVQRARRRIHETDARTLEGQMELVAIPAPPLQEAERGRRLCALLREAGLAGVHTDEVGNVLAALPGRSAAEPEPGAGAVVVAAHLDTIFPLETALAVRRAGSRTYAPGITDNGRGLAALLTLARVLVEVGARTARPLWFVGTVGEEGLGDLRGTKHLFREGSPLRGAAAFLSLDGSGLNRIVHRALGARRLRAEVTGPGGHSWSDWGHANPVHALGVAVAELRRIPLPRVPPAALTVARIGGGTSVNAIPGSAWLEVDIRSEEARALAAAEAAARTALARAVEAENRARRAGTPPLALAVRVIGDRPSGRIPEQAPLVRAAIAATRLVGGRPELVASSTDANVPISLGVPSITMGAGGDSGGVHTTDEWYDNEGGPVGIERALLVVLAAAGVAEEG